MEPRLHSQKVPTRKTDLPTNPNAPESDMDIEKKDGNYYSILGLCRDNGKDN